MRIVDRAAMQEIDRVSIQELGMSGELLMEGAGYETVSAFVRRFDPPAGCPVAVLCGGGNNGGDGFVIARLLRRRGFRAAVYLFVPQEKLGGTALSNYRRLARFGVPVTDLSDQHRFDQGKAELAGYSFLIDALLGIGFRGSPRGIMGAVIDHVNSCPGRVLSVDLPSGLDANGGQAGGLQAVHAELTCTMGALKPGLVDFPGKQVAGLVEVLDIGFPPQALDRVGGNCYLIDRELACSLVPPRRADAHKGTYGHLGVVGGAPGYEGAGMLAARAAARAGCGLVTLFLAGGRAVSKPDEIIRGVLPAEPSGLLRSGADLDALFGRQDTLVIGPGLGTFTGGPDLLGEVMRLGKKLLIDADGINNLAARPEVLRHAPPHTVLTPHIGEMARLTGKSAGEVKAGKGEVASRLSREYGVTVVLKDAVSVVASGEELYYNQGGVPALSKGGSGDVLSGIIASLMARGLGSRDASLAGVYLHTECGRTAGERGWEDSVQAGDLVEALPGAFRRMRGAQR
ncbi:MAG: NAD(P)H-hydrate dehydratase [Spirochaetota bacterium]